MKKAEMLITTGTQTVQLPYHLFHSSSQTLVHILSTFNVNMVRQHKNESIHIIILSKHAQHTFCISHAHLKFNLH